MYGNGMRRDNRKFFSNGAEVRARDFDYFSTDFVRSVFVVYAHDSI